MESFYSKDLGRHVSYDSIRLEINRGGMRIIVYVSVTPYTQGLFGP